MNYEDFKKLDQDAAIKAAAKYVGVEPSVIDGLWRTESGRGANKGPSRVGAMGDFQIMPGTQQRFEQKLGRKFNAADFHDSLFMAAQHLRDDLIREGGDVRAALRAYNNGPNWRKKADPTGENAAFPDKVLGAAGAPSTPAARVRPGAAPLTLDSQMPGKLDPLPKAGPASKRLDELERFAGEQPPRPLIQQQAVAPDATIAADAAAKANQRLADETSFLDQARAAVPHRGIVAELVRRATEDEHAPEAGYVVDPADLDGYSLDEQSEILEDGGTSKRATDQVKARIALRREDMAVVGRHGGLRAFAAQMLAGLPEGIAGGVGIAKTFALAGAGSMALAAQGARGAAAAAAVAENVGGNLLLTGIEDALGGRLQGTDYALAATIGLAVSPLQIKSSWAAATEGELMRQKNEALLHSAAEARRFYNEATQRLGPGASPEQIGAEVARMEAEGVKAQINAAVGPVRNDRRLLSEELANPYEASAEPVATRMDGVIAREVPYSDDLMRLFEEEGLADPVSKNITDPTKVVIGGVGMMNPWNLQSPARLLESAKGPSRAVVEKWLGRTVEEGEKLRPGVHADASVDPKLVETAKWLQKTFLPDIAMVLRDPHVVTSGAKGEHFRALPNLSVIGVKPGKAALATLVHEFGHAILVHRLASAPAWVYQQMKAFHKEWIDLYKGKTDSPEPKMKGRQVAALLRSPLDTAAALPSIGKGVTEPLGQEASLFDVLAGNVGLDGRPTKFPNTALARQAKEYWSNFDEMSAEQFGKYLEAAAAKALPGVELTIPEQLLSWFKDVWARLVNTFKFAKQRGYLAPDAAFVEFFEGVRQQAKTSAAMTGDLEVAPMTSQSRSAAALAADPIAEKYGFNLMPATTPQEAAEGKAVRALWERATNPEADWNKTDYDAKLSKLLKNNVFSNTSSTMLRSANPVIRMLAYELLENPAGAAGRRSTAALSKFITERAIMGNAINDLQMQYAKYRAAQGGSVVRDFTDGQLWERFNREVAAEVEARRMGAAGSDSEPVRLAADTLEAAYERSRLHQVNAKTIGWGSLPESSKGYMPHKLSPAKLRNMTNAQKQVLHSALVDQFQSIEGFDPSFSARLASKYIDRVESRAVGDYGTPVNIHQVGAAEVVEDALTAMGMSRPEVLAMMQRYMRGGASHTKARLKLDLLAEHDAGDGTTFRLLDLFETNQLNLLRSQAQRVSGEVALARHGIMGRPGLTLMRRAATFGEDGGRATDKELEALDQVSAEFLGAPFGTSTGKWADRAAQTTALARLGGMGFTQFAEYLNGIVPLGVSRVMAGVAGMPRLIGEARKLARGEKVDNPVLSSLEHEAAEFGTDSYKLVFPFDNPEMQYQLYGVDTVTFADRVLRAGSHLQGKLSFWRAIHSAQQRGMAEQIVLKAVKYIRDGKQSKALADMGFTPEVSAQLKAQLGRFVKFEGARVKSLDVTKLDPALANEFIQAVHRGSAQIIQGTFIGETGPWVHSGMLRLLTQFRSFSITSIEKQWGRNVNNYGGMAALGILMGSMSLAAPIYIARTVVTSYGREDREEYLEEALSFERVARASMNYVAMSSLAGDFLDAASTITGLGKSTGGRTGQATDFVGNVVAPSAGLANDLWKALQNTKDGTDVHELLRHMPFSKVPAVGWAINALD